MARLIDLSHPIEAGMTTYPGMPGPVITDYLSRADSRARYDAGTEFSIGRIEMIANTGTYLDTPFHRFESGFDLAGLALEKVADLPGTCLRVAGPELGAEILEEVDVSGHAVLFATGWDRHWRTENYGDPNHPFVASGLVDALVRGGAALVGIDSVNIDDTRGGARPAHTGLLQAGIPIVEHLTALDQLVGNEFRFYAVPAMVSGLGSFPIRAFAIVD
ncbi:MAG TPA: cyclase family protein [Acidimicrobiia bacterium]|nr:cyclase family protein [Acidimicrobiia bacterium]